MLFRSRGLGIDIDQAKIEKARANGYEACRFDILKLPDSKLVRFVTMSHFLEHLDSIAVAKKMIDKSISVSDDFVIIRQPWFDADGMLFELGFKFYWSHWGGHRNRMSSLDFHSILSAELRAGRIQGFAIFGRGEVTDSSHPSILPIGAPIDQHEYSEKLHGPKASQRLPTRIFKEIVVRMDVGGGNSADIMMNHLSPVQLLYRV